MSRRRVIIAVTPNMFEHVLSPSYPGQWWRTDTGLPPGAKRVGCGYDHDYEVFWFVFEHESFEDVPVGKLLPEFRGVQLHSLCVQNPLDAKQIAMIEKLTAEQVKRAEDAAKAIEDARRSCFDHGKKLNLDLQPLQTPPWQPEGDQPHIAGG